MKIRTQFCSRLRARLLRLRWQIWLRRRVTGRIKLQGHLEKLHIADSFRCEGDLWIGIYSADGVIHIDDGVSASGPLVITAISNIRLGRGVLLGPNVMVTDHYHGNPRDPSIFDVAPSARALYTRGPITVGDFVQVGANASILSPSSIGRAAIVGANSVVMGELPAKTVHAGVPAKPLNSRLPSQKP